MVNMLCYPVDFIVPPCTVQAAAECTRGAAPEDPRATLQGQLFFAHDGPFVNDWSPIRDCSSITYFLKHYPHPLVLKLDDSDDIILEH